MNAGPDVRAAVAIYVAIAETVREATKASPLGGIPSGHVYAALAGRLTLASYEAAIDSLVRSGLAERRGHLLAWIGPQFEDNQPGEKP